MSAGRLRSLIRDIPDFPKPGIVFKDITPLMASPDGFRVAVDGLAEYGRRRQADLVIAAVAELARYGVGGRNLRVFRSSADREANLLQQILAPALRSRNPQRRKEAVEALENLAAVATHLKHLLLIRDLRKIVR